MSRANLITDDMLRQAAKLPDAHQAIVSLMAAVGMSYSACEIELRQLDAWKRGGPLTRLAILMYWRTFEQLQEPELCC